ncbi:MAG: histidinol-phosphate transaminase [Rhodospirillaceae bacterium]
MKTLKNPGFDRRHLFKSVSAVIAGVAATGLRPTGVSTAYAATVNNPIRLLANENPYGPSESAQSAMAGSLADGWQYVGSDIRTLTTLIAEREGVPTDHVFVTAGSGELLKMAGLSFGLEGEIVAARPTFSMLIAYAKQIGGTVHEVDVDQSMQHDLAIMEEKVTKDTSLVYVCNPNNPTGTLLDADVLRSFINSVEPRATVFVDEAYVDLLTNYEHNTMMDQVKAGKNVILARTFSKIHGMAGLRVGYAIARPDLIQRLRPLQMSFANVMGIRAAIASYQDAEFQTFSRTKIRQCIDLTQAAFEDLGLAYTPSETNFVMFDTRGSVKDFATAMRERGLLVGRSYAPFSSWCRVSMGTVEQMAIFAEATRNYFKG